MVIPGPSTPSEFRSVLPGVCFMSDMSGPDAATDDESCIRDSGLVCPLVALLCM